MKTCSSLRLVVLFCSLELDVDVLDIVQEKRMEKQLKACKNMEVADVVVTAQVLTKPKYEACIMVATIKD